jgi:hypothetical protein
VSTPTFKINSIYPRPSGEPGGAEGGGDSAATG